jgi:pyridoxamine 5'-phosphate oxidase
MSNLSQEILGLHYSSEDKPLSETYVAANPFIQFEKWFAEAMKHHPKDANAFVLSTATKDARPSARIVLLKGVESERFIFYTNYNSRKGEELFENPFASMTFFWSSIEKQVRIEGKAGKVSEEESDKYFKTRPVGSKAGAWVSPQSLVISERDELVQRQHDFMKEHENKEILRPPFWGGFCIIPFRIEFWQGRANRLHDRILYTLENNKWKIERLAP